MTLSWLFSHPCAGHTRRIAAATLSSTLSEVSGGAKDLLQTTLGKGERGDSRGRGRLALRDR
jgi:hypothetical protein